MRAKQNKTILNKIKDFIKSKLTISCFLFTAFTTGLQAIEIVPGEFVYKLNSLGLTQDVTFYNRKDRPERVKISFKPYQTDSQEKYLGKWGTIFPKIITIGPKDQKAVKFSIEPPAGLPKGEYRAVLFMEELEQKALNPEGKVVLKEGATNSQINMLINLGVVVYGYSGDPETLKVSGKVSEEKILKNRLEFKLKNDGEITRPYRLFFEGVDKEGKNKIEHRSITVIEGYEDKVNEQFPKDMTVQKIYLRDSKNNLIKTFK